MPADDAARVRQEQRVLHPRTAAGGPAPGPADLQDRAYARLLALARIRRGQRIMELASGVCETANLGHDARGRIV
jgi:hypothetical protein